MSNGIETIYLYCIDEAKREKLAFQKKAWELVHSEGAKMFTAGYSDNVLRGWRSAGSINVGRQATGGYRHKAFTLHKNFSYANPQTGHENPELFRRNSGLELWRNDFGAMPYAYQDSMGFIGMTSIMPAIVIITSHIQL